jgi:hypothetical protein
VGQPGWADEDIQRELVDGRAVGDEMGRWIDVGTRVAAHAKM